MRVIETKPRSQHSGVEIVSEAIASFSNTALAWKTDAAENRATVISAIINDENSKALFKSLEKRREYDFITTHEVTIPSGSETAFSIGGDVQSSENKTDVSLIPTVLGEDLALAVEIQRENVGHNLLSGHVIRRLLPATRFTVGETVIIAVPGAFPDGRDVLLFITPQNLGIDETPIKH